MDYQKNDKYLKQLEKEIKAVIERKKQWQGNPPITKGVANDQQSPKPSPKTAPPIS